MSNNGTKGTRLWGFFRSKLTLYFNQAFTLCLFHFLYYSLSFSLCPLSVSLFLSFRFSLQAPFLSHSFQVPEFLPFFCLWQIGFLLGLAFYILLLFFLSLFLSPSVLFFFDGRVIQLVTAGTCHVSTLFTIFSLILLS